MNSNQKEARLCLAKFGPLIDPRYAPHPDKAEMELRENVKACWQHRRDFPDWVKGYVAKWTADKSHDADAVRSNVEGPVVTGGLVGGA